MTLEGTIRQASSSKHKRGGGKWEVCAEANNTSRVSGERGVSHHLRSAKITPQTAVVVVVGVWVVVADGQVVAAAGAIIHQWRMVDEVGDV